MHKYHPNTKQLSLSTSSSLSSSKRPTTAHIVRSNTTTTAQDRQAHFHDDGDDGSDRHQKLIARYSNSITSSLSSSITSSSTTASSASSSASQFLKQRFNNNPMMMQGPPGPGTPPLPQQHTSEPFIIKTLDVHEQIGSGGPLMLWKIYRAFTKKDAREVSVWIHDKAACERQYRKRAGDVYEILKRGVRELDRLSANSKTLLPLSVVEETM